LITEDISQTFEDYPLQKEMFQTSKITKISAGDVELLAKGNPNAKYIIVVCEFYWAPCVD
jgi:hypothetical protein